MQVFRRGRFRELWVSLTSSEALGQLEGAYLEDFDGNPGQVTLRHLASSLAVPLPLQQLPGAAAGEAFRGHLPLDPLPDGDWAIQGRARDLLGNETILGAVAGPHGGERVVTLLFRITSDLDEAPSALTPWLRLLGGYRVQAVPMALLAVRLPKVALGPGRGRA